MSPSQRTSSDDAVLRILAEVLPGGLTATDIQPGMSLQHDLGIESLGKVAVGFRLEEEYGIDLTYFAEHLAEIQSVGDLLAITRKLLI
jgi:acyl carrier protein